MHILSACHFGSESTGRLLRDRVSRFFEFLTFLEIFRNNLGYQEDRCKECTQLFKSASEIRKYTVSIILDLCVCESYNSAESCLGTYMYIYRLLKGVVLNDVFKCTHQKQAAKLRPKSHCANHAHLNCRYPIASIQ